MLGGKIQGGQITADGGGREPGHVLLSAELRGFPRFVWKWDTAGGRL